MELILNCFNFHGVNISQTLALFKCHGEVERYKARLVFKNHHFLNPTKTWDEVFSPVVDESTLHIFLAFAAQCKFFIRQIDIITAFLNAPLPDICYMKLPKVCGDPPGLVRQLFKALYGHVEAPKLWNLEWSAVMISFGFVQSNDRIIKIMGCWPCRNKLIFRNCLQLLMLRLVSSLQQHQLLWIFTNSWRQFNL